MGAARLVQLGVVLNLLSIVSAAVVTYDWVVNYSFQSPDCVEKQVITVNGQLPGPPIRATVGDQVVVNVKNLLYTEGVVIHWHGILQKGSAWADGSGYVSQCPIQPGETYVYAFTVTKAGTFFYHGHFGMQRSAGLYGYLIVDPAPGEVVPFQYDGELDVLLGDWWHKSMYEQELGLSSIPFRWVGEPQSILINGKGYYDCSLISPGKTLPTSGDYVSCNNTSPKCAQTVLAVEPGKTYRLRIGSVAALSSLNFILEGHNLTVVEVSGHYVEPVVVQNLDVYSGETFSVLFTANQDPSHNYWAGVNVRGRLPNTTTGLAILNYLPNSPLDKPTTPTPVSPIWNDFNLSLASAQKYVARAGFVDPLPKQNAARLIHILNTQNDFNGFLKWAINNVSYVPTRTPVLASYKFNLLSEIGATPPDNYEAGYDIYSVPTNPNTTTGSGVYVFQLGEIIDIVLQNANTLTVNNSEIHPWHLHGHDFWVLGYGHGKFDPNVDYANLNYVNPPLMNTAPVFPYGWTVLRFVANNPGAWPFHCHVEPHFHMGMGVVFAEGLSEIRKMKIPRQNLGCGQTKYL